jgi:predicted nucleic acid-binding protein
MVIVDTTVWIDHFGGVDNPETRWLDLQIDRRRLGLTDLVLSEVLQGIRDHREFKSVRRELLKFQVCATGGQGLAIEAAVNFRQLQKKGVAVPSLVDCWIATFCIREGHTLLHRDRDFEPFEKELGLRVVRP